jgi:hypothetical protein
MGVNSGAEAAPEATVDGGWADGRRGVRFLPVAPLELQQLKFLGDDLGLISIKPLHWFSFSDHPFR